MKGFVKLTTVHEKPNPTLRQFHAGLYTSDWHAYPLPPYRGRGWIVDFLEETAEFPRGGEYSGDQFYPYKEVILSARDQVIAQRASDAI